MTKRIPVTAAKVVAEKYGYDQIVIIGRTTGKDGEEAVATYGVSKIHCDVAAQIGNFFKYNLMKWDHGTKSRPDWKVVYQSTMHIPDRDGELIQVTRETLRLSVMALQSRTNPLHTPHISAATREIEEALK